MSKELKQIKAKIKKLQSKKALIDEQLEPLLLKEEELENQEIITICRQNHITLAELMQKFKENQKKEEEKCDERTEYVEG